MWLLGGVLRRGLMPRLTRLDRVPRRRPLAELGLHAGELKLDVPATAHAVQLCLDVVAALSAEVVKRATGKQLVDRACPRLHLRGLVLGALDRQTHVAHLLGDAGERL